jgi:septal ring factor EnvC (AmiA/AmiB activator)
MGTRNHPPPWPTDAIGVGLSFVVAIVAVLVPAWSAPLKVGAVCAALVLGAAYVALVRHIKTARSQREHHEAQLGRVEEDLAREEDQISRLAAERDRLAADLEGASQRESELREAFEQLREKSQELATVAINELAERDAELELRRHRDDWMSTEW